MREQPASTLAERAKLAASLNNQERVGWDCPARGIAAFAAANWQPYQNFALAEAYGTRLSSTGLASQNPQVFGEYADIQDPPEIEHYKASTMKLFAGGHECTLTRKETQIIGEQIGEQKESVVEQSPKVLF